MQVTAADYERIARACEELAEQAEDAYDVETLAGMAAMMRFEAGRKQGVTQDLESRLAGAFVRLRNARGRTRPS